MPLTLASQSPRRAKILAELGVDFTVLKTDAPEVSLPDEPERTVVENARAKLSACACTPALAADTIVWLDGVIYGKPADEADARRMLGELSGRTHQVITGVCVLAPDGERCFAEQTDVSFRSLSAAEIDEYVASGEPLDKAGAYGIQGLGGALVASTKGDFDNVVGLPITRLAPLLEELLA